MTLLIEPIACLRKGTIARESRAAAARDAKAARLDWRKSDPRIIDIVSRYKSGQTLEEIGCEWGVTRERIRQILKSVGLDGGHGGQAIRSLLKYGTSRTEAMARDERNSDAKHFEKYGMAREAINSLSPYMRSDPRHPLETYRRYRANAKRCGYRFNLKFADWWRIWEESGHYAERGRGYGYWMARWDSNQGFTRDNLRIVTGAERSADSYLLKPASARTAKAKLTRARAAASA